MSVHCEEPSDSTGPDIDLQCREHVASDTESEAENNTTDVSSSNASLNKSEPTVFLRQGFGSPSSIVQSSAGADITHRPKAIKAK